MKNIVRTLENRTAAVFAICALLLAALFFGVGYAALRYSHEKAAVSAAERLLSAAGKLAETTDIPEDIIAEAFIQGNKDYSARGEEILSRYGFEEGNSRGSEYSFSYSLLPAWTAAAAVLFCMLAALHAMGKIYRGIQKITLSAGKNSVSREHFSDREHLLLRETVNGLIRERKSVSEKLGSEKGYLADYLQDLSHQIRTPASGLTLNNEIMLSRVSDPEERGLLERDRICIERINRLCSESLKLARLDAGAIEYDMAENKLCRLTEKACAPLYELAARNGSELELDIPEDITLRCDELWLGEAVSNLVKNACEHTVNGTVTVTAEENPMAVDLCITDNGEGIADEDIPMLFRRFYSKRSERNPASVGIGMSIAKRITEDMHGKIFIDTEAGKGTKIRLEFLKN